MKRNLISTFNQLKVGRIDINFEMFITKQNAFAGNHYTDDVRRKSTNRVNCFMFMFLLLLLFQAATTVTSRKKIILLSIK